MGRGMATSTQFLDTLLAGGADLADIMAAFHAAEDAADGPDAQKIPYFRWQHAVTPQQKKQLEAIADAALADTQASAETLTLATGLMMRLSKEAANNLGQFQEAADTLTGASGPTILYEAGNILRAVTDWPRLEALCGHALEQFDRSDMRLNILADWFVLARYRQLVRKFEVNRLSGDDTVAFEAVIERLAAALGRDTKNVAFYQSILATLRGALEDAVAWILKAQQLPGKVIVLFQRLESFCSLEDLASAQSPAHKTLAGPLDHHFLHQAGTDPVLLLSADQGYVERYFDKLCESFGYWNPGGLVHLHCVGFALDEMARRALETSHNVRINYTADRQPAIEADEELFPGYCANARYLFLPQYLAQYQRIAITDIDGVIRRPLKDLWRKGEDAIRITTKMLDDNWGATRLMWEAIAAGSLAISNTPANAAFAWRVANYLADQVEVCRTRGMKLFYTDQIGLLLSYLASRNSCEFKPLSGLYRQRGRWAFGGGGGTRAAHQKALDYKTPDKPAGE